eukprot:3601171-Ditylum_brightwellii.AAC.2
MQIQSYSSVMLLVVNAVQDSILTTHIPALSVVSDKQTMNKQQQQQQQEEDENEAEGFQQQ